MTDHPRFQNSTKTFEESYEQMHGGGLVAIVLSWAGQWQRRRELIEPREKSEWGGRVPHLPSR